ncbi:hypothetical protein EST38_g3554 [Candolleomyces aberdarensis]|uniref:SH3 domain-containing protein n=1 Tax=Candolleomyces aberdarensis TaxID=2316362 RepID=A0A4Q2DRR3_9AGAR|nr:hypothetical protein EST38_g3554 [Candolleomyces aberdarensis]
MHAVRRHADHAHLRRITVQKLQSRKLSSLDSRSPQFGFGFGNGNGNGNGRGNGNRNGGGNGGDGGRGNSRFDRLTSWLGDRIPTQRTSTTPVRAATNIPAPRPTTVQSGAPAAPSTPAPTPSPDRGSNGGGNDGGNNGGNDGGNNGQSTSRTSTSANREANTSTSETGPRVASETSTNTATATGIGGVSNVGVLDSVVPNGQTNANGVPSATLGSDASPSVSAPGESGSSGPLVATGAAKTGLPTSAIAAIVVISLLVFLLVLVFLVRRHWMSRRRDRMHRWWSTNKPSSQDYNEKAHDFAPGLVQSTPAQGGGLASGFDHSSIVPTAPPVAEVRVPHGVTNSPPPMVFGHPLSASRRTIDSDRLSVGSAVSNDSNSSKFFVVHHPVKNDNYRESFKFPKPPSLNTTSELASIHTRNGSGVSGTSYAAVCSTPIATKAPSALSQPPITPPDPDSAHDQTDRGKDSSSANSIPNPFLDSPGSHTSDLSIPNSFAPNPFDDQQALASVGKFAEVEIVRRPFQPTLADELQVAVNDRVAVLEVFDDGWATVQKLQDGPSGSAQQKGLIPIACLREVNQDLSSFLNTKVVPSYRVSSQMSD